jgi:hypothetical protein
LIRQHSIKKDVDFIIERASSFDYIPKREKKATYTNKDRDKKIIFINFSKVHQDYHKEVSKRQGE